MRTARLNTEVFRRKIAAMRRGVPAAGELAVRELATASTAVMRDITRAEATDTGRYLRGLDIIQNDLGVRTVAITVPRESRRLPKIVARMRAQVVRVRAINDRWERNVEGYARKGPRYASWPSYKEALRVRGKTRKLVAFAQEQLKTAQEGGAVVEIGGSTSKDPYARRRLARTIAPLYGGRATINTTGGATIAVCQHMEPHARIVEKRTRVVSRGLAAARSYGLRRQAANMFHRTLLLLKGAA